MTERKLTDHIHAELLALQQLSAADIAFYKQQQWRVTNYGLLLYAAIIAALKLVPGDLANVEFAALWALTLLILVAGVYVIQDLDESLAKGRDRLPAAREHFDREVSLRAYARGGDPDDALKKSSEKPTLKRLFIATFIVGFVLTS